MRNTIHSKFFRRKVSRQKIENLEVSLRRECKLHNHCTHSVRTYAAEALLTDSRGLLSLRIIRAGNEARKVLKLKLKL